MGSDFAKWLPCQHPTNGLVKLKPIGLLVTPETLKFCSIVCSTGTAGVWEVMSVIETAWEHAYTHSSADSQIAKLGTSDQSC